jgi:hypothetical protein
LSQVPPISSDSIVRNARALANILALLDLSLQSGAPTPPRQEATPAGESSALERHARDLRALAADPGEPAHALRALVQGIRLAEAAALHLYARANARPRRRRARAPEIPTAMDTRASVGSLVAALRQRRREIEAIWLRVALSSATRLPLRKSVGFRLRYTLLRLTHPRAGRSAAVMAPLSALPTIDIVPMDAASRGR